MKRLTFNSFALHFATLCCFLLPFFYTGCEEKTADRKSVDSTVTAVGSDTLSTSTLSAKDTIRKISTSQEDSLAKIPTTTAQDGSVEVEDDNEDLSSKICQKLPLLSPLLVPKPYTYTGIALVINLSQYFIYYGVFLCFLFLLLSLTIKYIDPRSLLTIVLLEAIALICLFFSEADLLVSTKLWGYWVAFSFLSVLTICDGYILLIHRNKK